MSKQFWGVIILVIAIFVGIFTLSGGKSNAPGKSSNPKALTHHVIGQGKANVTLIEYGDYQCPYCGQYYPILKEVQTEFNDQIHFQFRNYPLSNLHPNAFAAARAAEAADLQNKFWEMHDLLYQNQEEWSRVSDPIPIFERYAFSLGLKIPQYKADYASSKVNDLINADAAEGTRLEVSGTPAFFLDGKKIEIGQSLPEFEKVIKAAIDKKAAGKNSTPATTAPNTTGSGTTKQTPVTKPPGNQ